MLKRITFLAAVASILCSPVAASDTSLTEDEANLRREILHITGSLTNIVTGRSKNNSTPPRILVDIEVKRTTGCRWVHSAARKFWEIGKVVAKSKSGSALPHLQYAVKFDDYSHASDKSSALRI